MTDSTYHPLCRNCYGTGRTVSGDCDCTSSNGNFRVDHPPFHTCTPVVCRVCDGSDQ